MADSNATNSRSITVDLPDYPGGEVEFRLATSIAIDGTEVFPGLAYILTLDGTGQGTQILPAGENPWMWIITLPDRRRQAATLAYSADPLPLATWLEAALSEETAASLADLFLQIAGGTMTGQINFSGTDHAGIKLLSLTTAERDALTPAAGMLIFNETVSGFQVYTGAAWAGGGTGDLLAANNLSDVADVPTAQQNLDLEPGVDVQAYDAELAAIAGLTSSANTIIHYFGEGQALMRPFSAVALVLVAKETVEEMRTSLGLGAGSNPQFSTIEVGDAVDTSLARESAGVLSVEGNVIYAANGVDVPVADGGTGASTAADARANLGALPTIADIVEVTTGRDIAASDGGKLLEATATAALNCPDGLAAGLQCAIISIGGTTTITADTTLQYLDGGAQTAASGVTVNTQCTLIHRGSNVWLALGDVEAI